jgi:Xaa-Pro aminopeptidase
MRSKYFKEKGIEMITITQNLVDSVWGSDKPSMPQGKVFVHEDKYAGLTVQEKFSKVAGKLDKKADALLITTLDDIDWIVNMRGNDIKCNPVFFSYAIFSPSYTEGAASTLQLFINKEKLSDPSVEKHLSENHI